MELTRRRLPSEVLKGGYSDEEVDNIYELGRFFLENGDLHKAETIMHGLTEVVPDYWPAWLGMACVHISNGRTEEAVSAARRVLELDRGNAVALIYLAASLMTLGDYNSAGTYLGELGEKIEAGAVDDPKILRLYRAQLARFQSR
ncbi:MAG: hypothetical protein D6719_01890 [Candidatus Dadabacteria bacterium]|nr:MAG: hypothetical protein D6719_01890 [Candidatus Dadabacteria bacterium]